MAEGMPVAFETWGAKRASLPPRTQALPCTLALTLTLSQDILSPALMVRKPRPHGEATYVYSSNMPE